MMVKAARHLASFIDDIADISRAEIHKLSVSIEPVPAGSVIADALDLIRPLSASHGVHLDPPPPASQHVFADPRRLRQVLLNGRTNGCASARKGSAGRCRVRGRRSRSAPAGIAQPSRAGVRGHSFWARRTHLQEFGSYCPGNSP